MEGQLKKDEQELMTRERRKKAKDAQRIRGIVHENDKRKGTVHAHDEMAKLMRHDEQELLRLWRGWHWDDNKDGWLDSELCAKERTHQHRRGGDRQRATREAQRTREVGREGEQDPRKARVVRLDTTAGGAETRAVRDRHRQS